MIQIDGSGEPSKSFSGGKGLLEAVVAVKGRSVVSSLVVFVRVTMSSPPHSANKASARIYDSRVQQQLSV